MENRVDLDYVCQRLHDILDSEDVDFELSRFYEECTDNRTINTGMDWFPGTVSGIVCNKCGETLPEMRAVDHLDSDFPLNQCPHEGGV